MIETVLKLFKTYEHVFYSTDRKQSLQKLDSELTTRACLISSTPMSSATYIQPIGHPSPDHHLC